MDGTKSDIDKHLERLLVELRTKEVKSRMLSIARLYFEAEDYANCQKYVEKYLTQESRDAAGHKLLGQALQKLGQVELALKRYKTSLDLCPADTSIILHICELLSDDKAQLDPERIQYWCTKADDAFPKHPTIFHLRKKLIILCLLDSVTLVQLLKAQGEAKPEDPSFHICLLEHYISTNEIKQAIEYAYNVEFNTKEVFPFENSSPKDWYKLLDKILKLYSGKANANRTWCYQLLLLTVKERFCFLAKGNNDFMDELYAYDEALEIVAKVGNPLEFYEPYTNLLKHHRGQFAFHAATYFLSFAGVHFPKANWDEVAVLMSIAFQSVPFKMHDTRDEHVRSVGNRWYLEATYRCSQAGHYLIQEYKQHRCNIQDTFKGENWKKRIYDLVYNTECSRYGDKNAKLKSHWLTSDAYKFPLSQQPHNTEVEAYDDAAQKYFEKQKNSLHYYVSTLHHYDNFAHFKCIAPSVSNSGPDTLDMLDLDAFLYCTALRCKMPKRAARHYPAHLNKMQAFSDLHRDWWKWAQTDYASLSYDNKVLLKRGIEVIRCIGNHGMDAEFLCKLGYIFSERAKNMTSAEEKKSLEQRAALYLQSAISLLEKTRAIARSSVRAVGSFEDFHAPNYETNGIPMFETKQDIILSSEQSDKLIEESRLCLGINYRNSNEYDKSIEVLSQLNSSEGYFQLAQTYQKCALGINSNTEVTKLKKVSLLTKARKYTFKAMEHIKDYIFDVECKKLLKDIELEIQFTALFRHFIIKYHSNKTVSTLNDPSLSNENRQTATGSQINTTERVIGSQSSVNERKERNTNKDESERMREIIKKIAKLTNEVNELKEVSFKTKEMGKLVVEGLNCENSPHKYQIPMPPLLHVAPVFPVSSTMPAATLPTSPITAKKTAFKAAKIFRSLPVNAVTTSSDTSPTCSVAPVSNITIPATKHTEGAPHNNQPPLTSQSVFSFSVPDTNYLPTLLSSVSKWKELQNATTSTFSWRDAFKLEPATSCSPKYSIVVETNAEKKNTEAQPTTVPVVKPPLPPKPKTITNSLANKQSGECNSLFKPTIPSKSPEKSSNKSQDDERDRK